MANSSDADRPPPGKSRAAAPGRPTRGALAAVALIIGLAAAAGYLYGRREGTGLEGSSAVVRLASELRARLASPECKLNAEYRALVSETADEIARLAVGGLDELGTLTLLAYTCDLAHETLLEGQCWEAGLALDPACRPAYARLGDLAMDAGQYERAVTLMRSALETAPTDAEFQNLAGTALLNLGRFDEARAGLEAFAARDASSPGTQFLLGQVALAQNDAGRARDHFRRAIALEPNHLQAYNGLATACRRLGRAADTKEALARFEELKQLAREAADRERDLLFDENFLPPRVAGILTSAGRIYAEHDATEDAARCWRRAGEIDRTAIDCRECLATLYHNTGKLADALAIADELVRIAPDNPRHQRSRGRLHLEMGHYEAAAEAYAAYCELTPSDAAGYAALARAYLAAEDKLDEAREAALAAVRLDPAAANYGLYAAVCAEQGDADAARGALERAMLLAPTDARYRQMRDALANGSSHAGPTQ